jgi:hypothetical protein
MFSILHKEWHNSNWQRVGEVDTLNEAIRVATQQGEDKPGYYIVVHAKEYGYGKISWTGCYPAKPQDRKLHHNVD